MNIVITGGSSGLGRELVGIFLAHGHNVTSIDKVISKITSPNFKEVMMVLDSNLDSNLLLPILTQCDVLINNAASTSKNPFRESSAENISTEIASNVMAPIFMMQIYLDVVQAKSPVIVNVSSNAANFPVPGLSLYGASKAMLSRLTLNLQSEISDVKFMNLELSGMRTGMQARTNVKNGDSRLLMDPAKVAAKVYRAVTSEKSGTIQIGAITHITSLARRVLPKNLFERIFAKIFTQIR